MTFLAHSLQSIKDELNLISLKGSRKSYNRMMGEREFSPFDNETAMQFIKFISQITDT